MSEFIVAITSSDSRAFLIIDTPSQIEDIKKDLIEIDLSESTFITLLKDFI